MAFSLFAVSVAAIVIIYGLTLWSWLTGKFKFWPPPNLHCWQYRTFWALFRVFVLRLVATSTLTFTDSASLLWLKSQLGWGLPLSALVPHSRSLLTSAGELPMETPTNLKQPEHIHNIVDALGSVAVLIGAAAIIWLDWVWVDAAITLLIAGYVLWQVVKMLPQATRVLMEGTPPNMDLDALITDVTRVNGVEGLHHLHVWELDEQHRALEAHVVILAGRTSDLESIKREIKHSLVEHYNIAHSTLEFEVAGSADHDCNESRAIVPH